MQQQARHPGRCGPRRRGTWRSIGIAAWLAALGACDGRIGELASAEQGLVVRPLARDIDELERIKLVPRECVVHGDCPGGSRCDLAIQQCAWDCIADSDCGQGHTCSALGVCLASTAPPPPPPDTITITMADDSPECQAVDPAERRRILLGLNEEQRACESGDDSCPCGAYCSGSGVCRVDCLADDPPPELTCGDGQACTPLGRCADSPEAPPPAIELTLATSPGVLVANTASAPAVAEVQVTVSTFNTAILLPEHPAKVFVGIAERRDVEPGVLPRVKCAPGDALADHCELDGGWLFDVQSGSLQSQPRTVWVELPRVSERTSWTLEARSEWALAPATTALDALAVAFPTTDHGHYRGTIRLTNPGSVGPVLDRWPRVPVEAIVTPTRVALVEPTRIVLPDGHGVLPREADKVTMLGWLTSDASAGTALRYDARLRLDELTYDATMGTLFGGLELTVGIGRQEVATAYELDLDRDDVAVTECTASSACAAGQYCNAAIGVCLPGSGPPSGGIVAAGTPAAAVSSELRSGQIAAWSAPLATVAAANPGHLGGPDALTRLGRAYCYRSPLQPGPASLGSATVEPSLDLACADSQPQGALGYANRTKEVETSAQGGVTFDLLEACRADLDAQPTAPATAAHLLDARACTSLGRFFLALDAAAGAPPALEPQRFVMQLARQWLGANAFAATSAVQHQALSDALDAVGSPAHVTLGDAVDRMERTWRVLLDPKVQAQVLGGPETAWAAGHPDYRVPARPVAQWSFNDAPPGAVDIEGGIALDTIGRGVGKLAVPGTVAPSMGTCQTQGPVAVSTRAFSVTTYLEYTVANTAFTLFEKTGPGRFWIEATMGAPGPIRFDIRSENGADATFTLPYAPSLAVYAFVFDGTSYRITRFLHNGTTTTFAPTSVTGPPAAWGPPGPIRLGCTVPHPGGPHGDYVAYDDLAIWDRPVTEAEVTAMGTRYAQIRSSLPDRPIVPPGEQDVGLPVHLLEAARAHVDLLSAYLEAERAAMYDECYLGGASPARDRALARTGRGLRMIHVADREAGVLAQLLEAQPAWLTRYENARHALAAKRNAVVEVVRRVQSCSNPLGITENDLPLYQGNAVGASERFFASSRFLCTQARTELTASNELLQLARNAYLAQRQSEYQVALSATEKTARLGQLRLVYDNQLRRYCGAPADGSSLLDAFLAGTVGARNCYLTESCRTLADTPLREVPPSCLRGEIGERLVAIQSAALDAEHAKANYERAVAKYDGAMDYCARRQAFNEHSDAILRKHHAHMEKLRAQQRTAALVGSFAKDMIGMVVGALAEQPQMALQSWLDMVGQAAAQPAADLAEAQEQADAAYQEVVSARSHELDMMACYHAADEQWFAIGEANDVIVRAFHDVQGAIAGMENAKTLANAAVGDARGELATEVALDRTPPHHHYWLARDIADYQRHLAYARRLTYLALRAFEWESQQSLGLRTQVLTAQIPSDLSAVVTAIEARNAPMQGENGVIGETPIVLSLRDEILRIEDLAHNPHRSPGDPPITSEEAFRRLLTSDATRVYRNGAYLGHGIRFSLRPMPWSQTFCAERIWRITTALQILSLPGGGELNNPVLVLAQDNAFASQQCRTAERGAMHVARVTPFRNLLVGDAPPAFTTSPPDTPMSVDGLKNMTRAALEQLPEGRHPGFAGRGVYGEYILLFPSEQFTPEWLSVVRDVLIRFDLVEVTNAPL